jgi:ferredoxin
MKLTIDGSRCEGHGRCWTIAPDLFDCDDTGTGVVRSSQVSADALTSAQRAVATCPEGAIELKDS